MNYLYTAFLSLVLYTHTSFAFVHNQTPNELYINEQWINLDKQFEIATKTEMLGVIHRKFFGVSLIDYDFFDPLNQKIASTRSRFMYPDAHFDVYDNEEEFIGMAAQYLDKYLNTFTIYARDAVTQQAVANMNYWGTTFTLYDPVTNKEMATLHRPFFSRDSHWTFNVTNRELFEKKKIDSRVLISIMAFQGDKSDWEDRFKNRRRNFTDVSSEELNALAEKVAAVSEQEGIIGDKIPDQKTMESVANELDHQFKSTLIENDFKPINYEMMNAFTEYCLNVVKQDTTSNAKKNTIIYLLKMRLQKE